MHSNCRGFGKGCQQSQLGSSLVRARSSSAAFASTINALAADAVRVRIFRSEDGMALSQRRVKREFRRLLGAAGIQPIRLYSLRHTCATLAVAAGVSVKVISEQLGHASISFTLERYSHVLPCIQDEAAARVERMLMGPPVQIIGGASPQPDQSQTTGKCSDPMGPIRCGTTASGGTPVSLSP